MATLAATTAACGGGAAPPPTVTPATLPAPSPPLLAGAWLHDAQGRLVGLASLVEENGMVRVIVRAPAGSLPPGPHGVHLHSVGRCDAPGFTSAGGHANPTGRQHGLDNPMGPHAGDLPNAQVEQSGGLAYSATTDRITLREGPNTLLDADGTAVVLHATADDQRTDPSGNSGARIACGVVVRETAR